MTRHILDANALYRLLTAGDGGEVVRDLLKKALRRNASVLMSVINWGEVYYTVARHQGYKKADAVLRDAKNYPIVLVAVDADQAEAAGRIRAGYGLPYADCFAAVLAGKNGVVVTADVKDFRKVPWLKTLALPPHKN
jgi:predicted nucleic acid-binding protein